MGPPLNEDGGATLVGAGANRPGATEDDAARSGATEAGAARTGAARPGAARTGAARTGATEAGANRPGATPAEDDVTAHGTTPAGATEAEGA